MLISTQIIFILLIFGIFEITDVLNNYLLNKKTKGLEKRIQKLEGVKNEKD